MIGIRTIIIDKKNQQKSQAYCPIYSYVDNNKKIIIDPMIIDRNICFTVSETNRVLVDLLKPYFCSI